MENIVIKGRISATSNKVDGQFQQETPTKTAYLEVADEESRKKLVGFGLTEYTSKEDGKNFFIIKLPKQVAVYHGEYMSRRDGGVTTPNFNTVDDKDFLLNIIRGNNKGNDFYRLQAILINDETDIEDINPENPFAEFTGITNVKQKPVTISDEDLPF